MLCFILFAVLLPACCLSQQQNPLPQTFPAVISQGHDGVCPSAEERAAIKEQINAAVRERLSQRIPFLLTNSSNCCEVRTHVYINLMCNCKHEFIYICCNIAILQVKEFSSLAGTGKYDVRSCNSSDSLVPTNQAYCDMETDGGGWLVIQRRIENGTVDFYRNWADYVQGFGDLKGEFWYGLENIHCLTTRDDVELRIEVANGTTPSIVWTYQLFRVGGASTQYTLTNIGQGTGVGGTYDAMAHSNGRAFSTPDMDNDALDSLNCAVHQQGPWWHGTCTNANLNARHESTLLRERISWYDNSVILFKNVEMKI